MTTELQNKTWSVLPKEFKEEVKRYYQHTDCGSYAEDILESIFGEYNLTSDAEGEVELLHVTRQKVMGLYANAKKIHDLYTSATCINTKESQQIDICKGVMSILDTLFGSKCLPDVPSKFQASCRQVKKPNGTIVGIIDDTKGPDYSNATKIGKDCNDDSAHHIADAGKMVDHIADASNMMPSRLHIAAITMAGLLASGKEKHPVKRALELTDALITNLNNTKKGGCK